MSCAAASPFMLATVVVSGGHKLEDGGAAGVSLDVPSLLDGQHEDDEGQAKDVEKRN